MSEPILSAHKLNKSFDPQLAGAMMVGRFEDGTPVVLQHGAGPEDYLLAHILASIAAFKGRDDARWLSAAALDRYLRSIHRNQVFGTQYVRSGSGPWEQAPFDRKLLPDTIRSEYGVPPLSEQHKKLEELRRSLGGKK